MTVLMRYTIIREGIEKNFRSCDKSCYDAKVKECWECPFGYINHGVGLEKAIENTKEYMKTNPPNVKFNTKFLDAQKTVKAEDLKSDTTPEVQEPIVVTDEAKVEIKEGPGAQVGGIPQEPIEGILIVAPRAKVIRGPKGRFVSRKQ